MLQKSIELLLRLGKTEGLEEKLDTLYVLGKLTYEEYEHYLEMLHAML